MSPRSEKLSSRIARGLNGNGGTELDTTIRRILERFNRNPSAAFEFALTEVSFERRVLLVDALLSDLERNSRVGELGPLESLAPEYAQKPVSQSFGARLEWLCHQVVRRSRRLSEFLIVEREILHAIGIGAYFRAESLLSQHSNVLGGSSIWSLNVGFFLAQRKSGLEGNKRLLNQIIRPGASSSVIRLVGTLSVRNEAEASATVFREEILEQSERLYSGGVGPFRGLFVCSMLPWEAAEDYLVSDYVGHARNAHPIDQLCCLIYALRVACFRKILRPTRLIRLLRYVTEYIPDSRLHNLLVFCDSNYGLSSLINRQFLETCDAYSSDKTAVALNGCTRNFLGAFSGLGWFEIAVKSLIRRGEPVSTIDGLPALCWHREVLDALIRFCTKQAKFRDRLDGLMKVCKMSPDASLSAAVFAFANNEAERVARDSKIGPVDLLSPEMGPRVIRCIRERSRRNQLLAELSASFPHSSSVRLINYVLAANDRDNAPPTRKHSRLKFYRGCRAEAEGMLQMAVANYLGSYAHLLTTRPRSPIEECEALHAAFRCADAAGKNLVALDIAFRAFRRNPEYICAFSLRDYVERMLWSHEQQLHRDIRLPIIAFLCEDSPDKVKLFVERFLRAHSLERASYTPRLKGEIVKSEMLFFIEHVCSYEVVRRLGGFTKRAGVLIERAQLCTMAIQMGSENPRELARERDELYRRAALSEGVEILSSSRVTVNQSRVLAHVDDRLRDLHYRYTRYREISNPGSLSMMTGSMPGFRRRSAGDTPLSSDFAFQMFNMLFHVLRDEFVFGEDGLDTTSLGMFIRHNYFHQNIVGRLQTYHFSDINIASGTLDVDRWRARLPFAETEWSVIRETILRYYVRISETVEHFAKTQIAAKSETSDKQTGYFDFSWSDEQTRAVMRVADEYYKDYDLFINAILDELWTRTRACAKVAREGVLSELGSKVTEIADEGEQALRAVSGSAYHAATELLNDWSFAKTELSRAIKSVSDWFDVTQVQPNFRVSGSVALNIAVGLLQDQHPAYAFAPSVYVIQGWSISSEHYPIFVAIWNILFENIVRHSDLHGNECAASVNVIIVEGRLVMKVQHLVGPAVDLMARRRRIQRGFAARPTTAKLSGAGGTGLHKLKKLIEGSLNRSDATYQVEIDKKARRMAIIISFSMEGIDNESAGR